MCNIHQRFLPAACMSDSRLRRNIPEQHVQYRFCTPIFRIFSFSCATIFSSPPKWYPEVTAFIFVSAGQHECRTVCNGNVYMCRSRIFNLYSNPQSFLLFVHNVFEWTSTRNSALRHLRSSQFDIRLIWEP